MAKIRKDIVGTVLAFDGNGQSRFFTPGEEVPDGFVVGDHVLDAKSASQPAPSTPSTPPATGANEPPAAGSSEPPATGSTLTIPPMVGEGSGADAWRAYALAAAAERGFQIELDEGAKRKDIIAALEAAEIPVKAS